MSLDVFFDRDAMDHVLYLLAKEYRRIAGRKAKAEIVLVGGAAIVSSFAFRETTMDIDAYFLADRDLKTAIAHVADSEGLPSDWLNDDFSRTDSFSPRLVAVSSHYKTFANCLEVRVVPSLYLLAMKLASWRQYKHDRSDAVSIMATMKKEGEQLSYETVVSAFSDLYGDLSRLKLSETELRDLIDHCNDELASIMKHSEEETAEMIRISLSGKREKAPSASIDELLEEIRKKSK